MISIVLISKFNLFNSSLYIRNNLRYKPIYIYIGNPYFSFKKNKYLNN